MNVFYLRTTKVVKQLIYTNVSTYIFVKLVSLMGFDIIYFVGLTPSLLINEYKIWQIFTYMFVHYHFFHLLMNTLMLWILGSELEMFWGEKFFLKYYLVAGLGAGVFIILLSFINPKSFIIPTIGSSGAVFGLLLAYGITFKNKILYIYGLIPIKAFKLVIILGVIEFLYLISNPNSTISHIAHLGGIITGFIYLKLKKIEKENKLKKYYEWKEKNIN